MKAKQFNSENFGPSTAKQYKELEKNNLWVAAMPESEKKPSDAIVKSKKRHFVKWNKFNTVSPFSKASIGGVTFQNSMKLTLLLGQCLGLNPVLGILSDKGSKLRFNYKSWRMLYCIILCLGQGITAFLSFCKLFQSGTSYSMIGFVSFYGSTFVTTVLFFRIAARWPTLVREVEASELVDPQMDPRLRFRIDMAAIIVLMLAVLEHILSLVARFAEITDCFPDKRDIYRAYIEASYPFLFEQNWMSYNLPFSIILQFMTISSTFNWNYSDLFIVNVSFYLTSRIEQINTKLKAAHGKYLPESVWRTFRKEYNRVTRLVRKFDDVISAVVFASFASNLFFICLQLYNTLRNGIKHGHGVADCQNYPSGPLGGNEHAVYFIFSLMFLILKSLAVSLIAARVHSASLVPVATLYAVPSPVYCLEVQRFLDQIHGEKVALTGLRFFHITKDLALTVAGTIVTYELVLLQFDSSS